MIAIIQARINSSRLFSKSIKKICGNLSSLDIILKKLSTLYKKKFIDDIYIATGSFQKNKYLNKYNGKDVKVYFGSELDVQSRFIKILNNTKSKYCIRLTADNPFIDIDLIEILIKKNKKKDLNYIAFRKDKIPYGSGVEIFNTKCFLKLSKNKRNKISIEHVTSDILKSKNSLFVIPPKKYKSLIKMRLTIDTIEDYLFAKYICKINSSCNPSLFKINKALLHDKSIT